MVNNQSVLGFKSAEDKKNVRTDHDLVSVKPAGDVSRRARSTLISVIMPVYNGDGSLDRAIASLRKQTYAAGIDGIDDSSVDDSHARLMGWAAVERRIRVLQNGENRGPSAARNQGLSHAAGEVVAYLDCDNKNIIRTISKECRISRPKVTSWFWVHCRR